MYKDYTVVRVDDISIVGQLFLPDDKGRYRMVCLCHGAPSGAIPDPADGGYPALAEKICQEGFGAFFFNFRGSGDSGGNMDLAGWTRDLKAVIDYLEGLENIDKAHLYLVGFSAGAAVSVYVASKNERVSGVAACACPAEITPINGDNTWETFIENFRTIGAIRDEGFPPSVEEWAQGCRMVSPERHIAGIAPRPLLLVHGSLDRTVPVEHAHRLYEKAGAPKKLVVIEGAGHRLRREDRAVGAVLDWLKSL
jgi:alpha-beta hydrolase superfamily lysophospholipase